MKFRELKKRIIAYQDTLSVANAMVHKYRTKLKEKDQEIEILRQMLKRELMR